MKCKSYERHHLDISHLSKSNLKVPWFSDFPIFLCQARPKKSTARSSASPKRSQKWPSCIRFGFTVQKVICFETTGNVIRLRLLIFFFTHFIRPHLLARLVAIASGSFHCALCLLTLAFSYTVACLLMWLCRLPLVGGSLLKSLVQIGRSLSLVGQKTSSQIATFWKNDEKRVTCVSLTNECSSIRIERRLGLLFGPKICKPKLIANTCSHQLNRSFKICLSLASNHKSTKDTRLILGEWNRVENWFPKRKSDGTILHK